MEQSVPKRRHTKFRRRGITQKKAYNLKIQAWSRNLSPLNKRIHKWVLSVNEDFFFLDFRAFLLGVTEW
jgi:hypothetical protein